MKISIIGTGYVGLVSGICFAYLGHEVLALDKDEKKIQSLRKGKIPIYEPELDRLFSVVRKNKRISFTTDYKECTRFGEFIFIAVGTPPRADGSADLSFVRSAIEEISNHLREGELKIIVTKSTVPVGTGRWIKSFLAERLKSRGIPNPCDLFDVVSNPEFLREGKAVQDFMSPDRVIIGADNRNSAWRVASLYEKVNPTLLVCDISTAEMIKYASNAFLATKISFINEMSKLCESLNADIETVSRALGLDHRISPAFLKAGLGFGGSCLPKDVSALISIGKQHNVTTPILQAVMEVNNEQQRKPIKFLKSVFPSLKGVRVGLLGLSFKPETDDVRNSPSLVLAQELVKEGSILWVHDPIAIHNFLNNLHKFEKKINVAKTPEQLITNCDAVIIVTDWPDYKDIDISLLQDKVVFDGRNMLNPEIMNQICKVYEGIGRTRLSRE